MPFRLPLLLSAVLIAAILLPACSRGPEKRPLEIDPVFSVNVIPVPDYWPREKLDFPKDDPRMRRLMREALAEHGRPDFLWMVQTYDRRPVHQAELRRPETMSARRSKSFLDWVYLEQRLVVSFEGGEIRELPLTDKIRTICLYGDPNEVRPFRTADGRNEPRWIYYAYGLEFAFSGHDLVGTFDFTPLPGFEIRR